jgi:hypothetical protein
MPRVKQIAPPIDPNDLFKGLRPEQDLWLRRFLDVTDKACFMRPEQTAKAIGKSANFGLFQKNILGPRIKSFLSTCGLDEQSLRCKLVELLHVRTTKTMVIPGQVEEWELPDAVRILGVFQRDKVVGVGEFMTTVREDVTLVCIDEEAPDLQRRALDMAFKINGTYAPEKHQHTGLEEFLAAIAGKSKDLLDD